MNNFRESGTKIRYFLFLPLILFLLPLRLFAADQEIFKISEALSNFTFLKHLSTAAPAVELDNGNVIAFNGGPLSSGTDRGVVGMLPGYQHLAVKFHINDSYSAPALSRLSGSLVRVFNPDASQYPADQLFRELVTFDIRPLKETTSFLTFRSAHQADAVWQRSPFTRTIRRLLESNRDDFLLGTALALNDLLVFSGNTVHLPVAAESSGVGQILYSGREFKVISRDSCLNLLTAADFSVADLELRQVKMTGEQRRMADLLALPERSQVFYEQSTGLPLVRYNYSSQIENNKIILAVLSPATLPDARRIYFYSAFLIAANSRITVLAIDQVNFCSAQEALLSYPQLDPQKALPSFSRPAAGKLPDSKAAANPSTEDPSQTVLD